MAAPTRMNITVGQPNVFYVKPPMSTASIFAAFTANYLQQRTEYAKQAWAHRLSLMKPKDYTQAILDSQTTLAGLMEAAQSRRDQNIETILDGNDIQLRAMDIEESQLGREDQVNLDNASSANQAARLAVEQTEANRRAAQNASASMFAAQQRNVGKSDGNVKFKLATENILNNFSYNLKDRTKDETEAMFKTSAQEISGWVDKETGTAKSQEETNAALIELRNTALRSGHYKMEKPEDVGRLDGILVMSTEGQYLAAGSEPQTRPIKASSKASDSTASKVYGRKVDAPATTTVTSAKSTKTLPTSKAFQRAVEKEKEGELYALLSPQEQALYNSVQTDVTRMQNETGKIPNIPSVGALMSPEKMRKEQEENAMVEAVLGARQTKKNSE